MIMVRWFGQVVSDNDKTERIRGGRVKNTAAYTAFRQSVAWTVLAARGGMVMNRPGLLVQFSLSAQRDAQNCLKGLLDGIQDSGLVSNDRDIAPITVLPTIRHTRGAEDAAELVLWEGEP